MPLMNKDFFSRPLAAAILAAVLLSSCNSQTKQAAGAGDTLQNISPTSRPSVTQERFGQYDSQQVVRYTLVNSRGMKVSILNYGGTVTEIVCADRVGVAGDVVMGFDSLSGYLQKNNPYIGALIGRYGNRIAHARFVLDGKTYKLGANDHGNSLHGGMRGFDKVVWSASTATLDSSVQLKLAYNSKDGEEGYPGNLHAEVVYSLTDQNELKIEYTATTDKPTPVNLTNHSYFNLSAAKESSILDHEVFLNADRFTKVNTELIPTGELPQVLGTPMDFRKPKMLGLDIAKVQGGYDHNFVLNKKAGELSLAATVYDSLSGRLMQMYTTEPGVQFYSGNFLDGTLKGKQGIAYGQHYGLALEAQHFPDSPNQPSFPNCILHPGETYHQITVYKFSVK